MKPLEGKVAIVTGAGRGIGHACAFRLGVLGCKLVLNDIGTELDSSVRDSNVLFSALAEMTDEGVQCVGYDEDISIPANCYRLAEFAVERYGRLDILIHAAAFRVVAEWPEVNGMMIRNTFQTNVYSTIFLTNVCAAFMQRGGGGNIVHFASGSVNDSPCGTALYAASKAAVDTYCRVVAKEMEKFNIKVNCIWPGAKTRLNPNSTSRPQAVANFITDDILQITNYFRPTKNGEVYSVDGNDIRLVLERTYAYPEE